MIVVMIAGKELAGREKSKVIHRFAGSALAFRLHMKNRTLSHEQERATVNKKDQYFFIHVEFNKYIWISLHFLIQLLLLFYFSCKQLPLIGEPSLSFNVK